MFLTLTILRAHSFPRKTFTKFRGPVRKISQLTAAFRLLSCILSKKLHFLEANMVLSYVSNIQKNYQFFSF